jgi:hypothetical protein
LANEKWRQDQGSLTRPSLAHVGLLMSLIPGGLRQPGMLSKPPSVWRRVSAPCGWLASRRRAATASHLYYRQYSHTDGSDLMHSGSRNPWRLFQALVGFVWFTVGIIGLFRGGLSFASAATTLFGVLIIASAWYSNRNSSRTQDAEASEWRTVIAYSAGFLSLGVATLIAGVMRGSWYLPVAVVGFVACAYIGVGVPLVAGVRAARKRNSRGE